MPTQLVWIFSEFSDLKYVLGFDLFADPNLPLDTRQKLQRGETINIVNKFSFDLVKEAKLYPTSKSGEIDLDIMITALKSGDQSIISGYLVQVQDITERVRAKETLEAYQRKLEDIVYQRTQALERSNEQLHQELTKREKLTVVERDQRTLAEALRDMVIALSSSLHLDEVLSHVLSNIGRVVPYDAVIILLIEDGHLRSMRYQGFSEDETKEFVREGKIPLDEYPNLLQAKQKKVLVLISDTHTYPGWVFNPETKWMASNITTPILSKENVIGFINVYSRESGYYSEEHIEPLKTFARHTSIAISNARLYKSIQNLAIEDELTGLYNRRGLYEWGIREVSRVQRFKRPLSAIFVDIDHFKQFNDQYSYAVGDMVLTYLAKYMRSQMRDVDLVARYGGEEFVILLPEIPLNEAVEVAERLRRGIAKTKMRAGKTDLYITISLGVAPLLAQPGFINALSGKERSLLSNLIEQAGKKLHEAKEGGRNRVAF